MMNDNIEFAESSEELEQAHIQALLNFKAEAEVQDLEQANIQARLNAKAETEVSSPSSAWTAPASASAPAAAASIWLDSAPSISGDAASSVTLLQDYESSRPPAALPSVALNTPVQRYGVENTNNAADVDANIAQVTSPSSTFGPEALGVSSSTIEQLYYMIRFHREMAAKNLSMAYEMEWQMQSMWPMDTQHSYINEEKFPGDGGAGLGESNASVWPMDMQYSYINEEQLPGDGGAGLGESNTSMAVSLEEGGANDLAHVDINKKGKEIPRSQDPLENARLRKEHFVALTAKKQFNYQQEFQ